MSIEGQEIKGKAEIIMGTVEKTIGKVVGSEEMEHEGEATVIKGKVREATAKVAEAVTDEVDKLKAAASEPVDDLKDSIDGHKG